MAKGNGADRHPLLAAIRKLQAEQDPETQVLLVFLKSGGQLFCVHSDVHGDVMMTYGPTNNPTGAIPLDNIAGILIQPKQAPADDSRIATPPGNLLVPKR